MSSTSTLKILSLVFVYVYIMNKIDEAYVYFLRINRRNKLFHCKQKFREQSEREKKLSFRWEVSNDGLLDVNELAHLISAMVKKQKSYFQLRSILIFAFSMIVLMPLIVKVTKIQQLVQKKSSRNSTLVEIKVKFRRIR